MSCPNCQKQPAYAVVMTCGFPENAQTIRKLRLFDDSKTADKTARDWFDAKLDDIRQKGRKPRRTHVCSFTVHFEGQIVDELGVITTIQVTENIER